MEQNSRHSIGDVVYLSPETTHMLHCCNPLCTKGVVVQLKGDLTGSPDYLTVDWDGDTRNSYRKSDVDLMTEDEYLDSCRKGASTIGTYSVNLEGATLDKTKMVIEDSGDVRRSTTTPSQKLSVRDTRVPTEDTVGIAEVDQVIPTDYSFGKDVITKLSDDIYEKARMNLSTSQSHELKDIVLGVLNGQDK